MSALNPYDASDDTAAQNAVWELQPHIILGTGSDTIPENESTFYVDRGDAAVVEAALDLESGSYNPIGVTYDRVNLPHMIATMYRLAEAADEVVEDDSSLSARYGDPIEIAKDYERYIVGQKGIVKKAIDGGNVKTKTIALVESYDSDAKTYEVITDGVAEGTATTNRYLEAVQGVTNNYYDTVGEAGASSVTADQLKDNVDVIILGTAAGTDNTGSVKDYLQADGLADKTFYCVNWANGSAFGTTVNSVENAQNIGRILPCVYPEVLDQSDMIAYYYDTFYHLKSGSIASIIDERMDGVRNWAKSDSASYTNWDASDVSDYNHDQVENLLKYGIVYLNSQSGLSDYLTPSSYLEGETSPAQWQDVTVGAGTSISKSMGDAAFNLNAKASGNGALSYSSSDESVATVNAAGKVTIKGPGTTTIAITADAKGNYLQGAAEVTLTVEKGKPTITASDTSVVAGKTVKIGATTNGEASLTYTSSNSKVATVSSKGVITGVKAGTANITISSAASDNFKAASKTIKVTVASNNQSVSFAKQTKTVTAAAAKKKAQTVAINKASAKTTVTYSIEKYGNTSAKKYITSIAKKTGKLTVKKGTPKGAYKVTVKATAAPTTKFAGASKSAVVTIKVK